MKKTFCTVALTLIMILSIAGCSLFKSGTDKGEIGKLYKTEWFNFEIRDFKVATEYAGFTSDGYKYVIFTIWEKNTFNEEIPMAPQDFLLENTLLSYNDTLPYGASAFDNYEKCMPDSFSLTPNQEVEYEVVFIIPEEIMDFAIYFKEIYEDEIEGDTFKFPIVLE